MAILTMDTVLRAVLSTGGKEQNQAYPPQIYDAHFNLVTSFLLDEVATLYPTSQKVVDIARPFLRREVIPVRDGLILFPKKYRHLLGMGIFTTKDLKGNCTPEVSVVDEKDENCEDCKYENDPLEPTLEQIRQKQERAKCRSVPVTLVDVDEWDERTTHPYKYPTLKRPIACIFQGEGIRICPFDVPTVEMRYLIQPETYRYGYVMNPDDTYAWNPASTLESQWTDNAFAKITKGITTLFSIYTRDGELRDGMLELKQAGIF